MKHSMISSIEEGLADYKAGKMLVLVDDEDRENEGDVVFAASHTTPEKINFMARHARGMICLASPEDRLRQLDLNPLPRGKSKFGTNFYDPIDAVRGTTTGISAQDRAKTILTFIQPDTRPADLGKSGHVHTLGAVDGGVLRRAGHTEGAVDLSRVAELPPFGVVCEIMNEDGSMARLPQLQTFAKEHGLKIITIRDLIEYRLRREKLVTAQVSVPISNEYGVWNLTYYDAWNGEGHLAISMGDIAAGNDKGVLVRVHSQCFTGDTLGSYRCDCGPQLHAAMKQIAAEGVGVIVYMHQEGRGIGLKNKLLAYQKQDQGMDTIEANTALGFKADLREYGIGAQILMDLGVRRIRLMTNNPKKIVGIGGYNLEVVDRVPLEVGAHEQNKEYLATKRDKMGHLFGAAQQTEQPQ